MKKHFVPILFSLLTFCLLPPNTASAATNHTQSEAVAWIQDRHEEKWANDYDGFYPQVPQCVDLIIYYCDYLAGWRPGGYAYAYVGRTDLPDGWTYQSTPSPGDIAVWGANVGVAGENGHVALVEWADTNNFNYIDIDGNTGRATSGTISNSNPSTFIHPGPGFSSSITAEIPKGTYYLRSAINMEYSISVANASKDWAANIQLAQHKKEASQQFEIIPVDGKYAIKNINSGLALDVENVSSEAGANVQQYHYWPTETASQRWIFEDCGDGYYFIRSELGTYLDVYNGIAADGQNIQTYTRNGTNAQKFQLELVAPDISMDSQKYHVGQDITVEFGAITNLVAYDYYLTEFPQGFASLTGSVAWPSKTFDDLGSGHYTIFAQSRNAKFTSGQSNWITFDVYEEEYNPTSQKVYDGHTYYVYDYEMSWTFARDLCKTMGGHLVTINNAAENSFITDLISTGSKDSYWIGATNYSEGLINQDGEWGWVTDEAFNYTNWKAGEPSASGTGGSREHWAEIRKSYSCQWNDVKNTSKEDKGFILELDSVEHNQYTVEFNAKGGNGTMANQTVTEGDSISLPSCTFTAPNGKQFKAWKIAGTEYAAGASYQVTGNTEVIAIWQDIPKETYTVSFNANGGSGTMASQTITEGDRIPLPSCTFNAPSGKQFKAWKIGGIEYAAGISYQVTGNTEVIAIWQDIPKETYTVSFNANGGSGTMASQTITEGDRIPLPSCTFNAPSGKQFKTWKIGGIEYAAGASYQVTGNAEVMAVWQDISKETYTVSFNANGGSGTMASQSIIEGDNISLPACAFTAPSGKQFKAWKIAGTEYAAGASYQVTGNAEVMAVWQDISKETYTVSFNANGGSGTMASQSIIEGDNISLPACAFTAPSGKQFKAWKIAGTEYAVGASYQVTGNTEVMVAWEDIPKETYTVSFYANGGNGTMASQNIIEGDNISLPACAFTAPNGKQFKAWKIAGTEFAVGASYLVTSNTEVVTVWEDIPKETYTVSFNANGGSGTMANQNIIEGNNVSLPACTFIAPSGKQFKAWKIAATEYAVGASYQVMGNTEVMAVWQDIPKETYTVSFNANGGSGTMASQHIIEGDSFMLPTCTFTAPSGKQFKAWEIAGNEYVVSAPYKVTGNTTITAVWQDTLSKTQIVSVSKTVTGTNVTIFCLDDNATVFCASYDADGRMTGIESKLVSRGQNTYDFSFTVANSIKVFVLDAGLRPLCESQSK